VQPPPAVLPSNVPASAVVPEALAPAVGVKVTKATLGQLLARVGRPDWEALALQSEAFQGLVKGGTMEVTELSTWCIMERQTEGLVAFLTTTFPQAVLREKQGNSKLRYEIPSRSPGPDGTLVTLRLSSIFAVLEERKAELRISDYSVSGTSLEQIFNSFASTQMDMGAAPMMV
jgi:hypothetical protein